MPSQQKSVSVSTHFPDATVLKFTLNVTVEALELLRSDPVFPEYSQHRINYGTNELDGELEFHEVLDVIRKMPLLDQSRMAQSISTISRWLAIARAVPSEANEVDLNETLLSLKVQIAINNLQGDTSLLNYDVFQQLLNSSEKPVFIEIEIFDDWLRVEYITFAIARQNSRDSQNAFLINPYLIGIAEHLIAHH